MVIFRLILMIILFCSFYYISFFFTLCFTFYSYDINIKELLILFYIFYLLLEYLEYFYKKANEFYHFFFWLLYIIFFFVIYISSIKVFVLTDCVYDFLIQLKNFKIQILYSKEYKITFFEKTLNVLGQLSPMSDEKILIVLENIRKATDYTFFEQKITLDSIKNYATAYINIASKVYDIVPFLMKRY